MKIIGSDYDGTLNYKGITQEKTQAIERWRNNGNVFALVSGRGCKDVVSLYREKRFPCDYLISNNGAVVMTADGRIVCDKPCEGGLAVPVIELLFNLGCPWGNVDSQLPCRVYANQVDCTKENEFTLQTVPAINYFYQISTVLPDFETAARVTACIKERFDGVLNPLQNGECIDIVRADVNKAEGLYVLAEHLGAAPGDIIAVGDNINDTDMIKEFRSYAMENGVDAIKAIADYVTSGVDELIEKELLLSESSR